MEWEYSKNIILKGNNFNSEQKTTQQRRFVNFHPKVNKMSTGRAKMSTVQPAQPLTFFGTIDILWFKYGLNAIF